MEYMAKNINNMYKQIIIKLKTLLLYKTYSFLYVRVANQMFDITF